MQLKDWLSWSDKKTIEDKMLEFLKMNNSTTVYEILKDQIFPSKRIRSYFLYLLAKDTLSENDLQDLAVAIELLHQATLIEDDLEDQTDIRDWNRKSLHIKYDIKRAYLLSLLLYIISWSIVSKLKDKIKDILPIYLDIMLRWREGQWIDITLTKKEDCSRIETTIQHSYQKTSAFMEFPFHISAILQWLDNVQVEDYIQVWKSLWILYQVWDDIIDIDQWVKEERIALTFPLAYILDNKSKLDKQDRIFIDYIIENKNKKLSKEEAEKLTLLYYSYKDQINLLAKVFFQEHIQIIQQSYIPEQVKESIFEVLRLVSNPLYWQYS